ncbi:hypothetical protein SLEP1_g38064 [Rubroshorea leprosula]|uniref:Uncharacterized protein n=1 Tax=Rubroshorea leprosula TaxID=152421 RepID=A0AAV5KWP9_9ROSI|nr:hypothetical protein SLEP1_g38064 [Rubroshorea leprosula]
MVAARSMWMFMMMLLLFAACVFSAQAAGRQLSDTKNGIASTEPTASNGLDGGNKAAADGKQVKPPENIKEKGVEKMESISKDDHFSNGANHHESGLMVFNVDYSAPRHHPPTNN